MWHVDGASVRRRSAPGVDGDGDCCLEEPDHRHGDDDGGVASLDPNGGGGISYYAATAHSILISGAIADGGRETVPPTPVHVSAGELLYFMIAPPVAGLGFNSTSLNLTITTTSAWPTPAVYR